MNIVAEFQYTLEEFKEGLEAIGKAQEKNPSILRQNRVFFILIILALALMALLKLLQIFKPTVMPTGPSAPAPADEPWRAWLPGLLPWVAVFSFFWFFAYFRMRRRHIVRSWDTEPALHRPRKVEIDEEGVSVSDSVSQHRTLWSGYTRFVESPNLFLLFLSDQRAELIPKRAFANEQEVQQVRELFAANISAPPQGAFPVVPLKAQQSDEQP